MKRNWMMVAVVIFCLAFTNISQAAVDHALRNVEKRNEIKNIEETGIRSLYITLEETEYRLDELQKEMKVAPYIRDGKTYMPLDIMEEAFHTPITWNLMDYSAIVLWQGNVLKISLPENKIYYKGEEIGDISADILEVGVLAVPIAEILSILEIPYEWLGDTSSVFMYWPEEHLYKKEKREKLVTEEKFISEFLNYLQKQAEQEEIDQKKSLVDLAKSRLGMPYIGGATGPNAFDCSGFVHWVLTTSGEKSYTRGSSQSLFGLCDKIDGEDLKAGDLVFFTRTYSARVPVTHSAIYIGDGLMIHAAGNRVQITPLSDGYWNSHFYAFGRIR